MVNLGYLLSRVCTLYSVRYTLYTVYCRLYRVQSVLWYNVQYAVYSAHIVYIIKSMSCILYRIQYYVTSPLLSSPYLYYSPRDISDNKSPDNTILYNCILNPGTRAHAIACVLARAMLNEFRSLCPLPGQTHTHRERGCYLEMGVSKVVRPAVQ